MYEYDYEVESGEVYLSVVVGDLQIGTSVVKLNGSLLQMGEIDDLLIGEGSELEDGNITVKTVVTDANDDSNHVSVTYYLEGGMDDEQFTRTGEVDEDGGSLIFRTKINLI